MERISILGFVLAVLYFITTELACNGYTHISNNIQSEQEALIDFKRGLKDPNNRLSSWKGSNYCYWQGITCEKDTGIVISIDLHNPYPRENVYENWSSMNLSGEIRPSLTKLKSLKYLDLSFNSFKGMPIPQLFGSLKNLLYLNLSGAEFSGIIPSNFGNLSNLQYLDLSSEDLSIGNIEWMASLVSLKYLGMDYVNLSLVGSEWVEVLNKLPILTELHLDGCGLSGSIPSPSFVNFTSLLVISINSNQFISMFPEWLLNVSSLGSIDISNNQLHGRIPLGLSELPNLQYIDLCGNGNLRGNISQLLRKSWKKIEFLNLGGNKLHGPIPSSFGNFCNLKYLNLGVNCLNGSLPEIIKGIETCSSKSPLLNLTELYLNGNQLMGKLPNWLGELKNLRGLGLSNNRLEGPIPASLWTLRHLESLSLRMNELNGSLPDSIGQLSRLQQLDVSYNDLSGSLPDSIGQLSELQVLDVGSNQLSGSVSEQHFWKLSKLEYLHMDSNSFRLNVSPNWVPPFQVKILYMGSCHLGPSFPVWLQSQKNLKNLDFSNASISSRIPNWFWNISFNLQYLSLSHNQLQGQLPNSLNFSSPFLAQIDFSSNLFEGPILFSIKGVEFLDLSHNKFSGPIPLSRGESLLDLRYLLLSHNQITGPIPSNISESTPNLFFLSLSSNQITGTIPDSIGHITSLEVIDFSRNNLIGSIPSTINNCSRLIVLDLGNNNLSGMIPKSLGRLQLLQSLHLNDNKLSGELPSSFQNLSSLELLDLSYNELSGKVPSWIGTAFINLVILNLRLNAFFGRLPDRLSNLSSLHVLDLAQNNLTGKIPVTLVELKAMAQEHNMDMYSLHHNGTVSRYDERLIVITKGQSLEYTRTLSLVVSIDLSDNNLSGEFPEGITKLFGLVFLNLSMNHIIGQIPGSISMLCQLSSLDLSSNKLSGTIPSSMPSLTFLSYLNLSDNNFSGKIPFTGQMTTFTELAFAGNPNLCGTPLVTKCQDEDLDNRQSALEDKIDGSYVDQWFYLSIGLGFAVGILVPYFVLAIRRSWCDAYFDFVDKIVKWLLIRRRVTDAKNHARRQ
ncbi:receptor-like protein EIX1 isoform X2 [Vitis riparia]|uniref:receptor-like protein EIX1 isoform X2 n=1 Tax=Vitis riparia TaxID=96939 RepID=UPI00155B0BEF|nr:receptor-like protein EIX1 isoform X2 [Vitis riparia]